MKIYVDRLTQTPDEETFEVPESWWRERTAGAAEFDYELVSPFRFTVRSYITAANIIFEGDGSFEIEAQCGRCLSRYRHALRDEFRLMAEDAKGRVPEDPEGVESLAREGLCLTDDIESAWYKGRIIQLDGIFGELVAGAMPLHPICKEDCKGLCQVCGGSLNNRRCNCKFEVPETKKQTPFAVLAQLRDESAGEK